MRFKAVGNKADLFAVVVRNAEATATMPIGTPICLNMNGTNDGLDVILPSTGGAQKAHAFAYGVVVSPATPNLAGIPSGGYGEAQIFGFCQNCVLTRQTRANSGVSWASENSIASYVLLQIDTTANGFSTSGGTQAATAYLPFAILQQSLASYSSSTSATSDTRTALTALVKAFLRII